MKLAAKCVFLISTLLPVSAYGNEDLKLFPEQHKWVEIVALSSADPNPTADVLFYRGLALAQLNRLAEAAATFADASKIYPDDKRFPIELAGVAYRNQQAGPAKRYLHQALRLDPLDAYANEFLATLYIEDQNTPAALRYLNTIGKPLLGSVTFTPESPLIPLLRERTFQIAAGQIFTTGRLLATDANLRRLDIVTDVRFELVPSNLDERYQLIVRSAPDAIPFSGWLGKVAPLLRGLPYQEVQPDWNDIGRLGINVTSLLRWDTEKRRRMSPYQVPGG